MNEEIRVREIRLVDENQEQLGVMSPQAALKIAQERNLDLVEIAPTARPPVCRLMDYGKYRFEQNKREKEAKKKQKIINIKEVKFRLNIEEHDFQIKAHNAERFLLDGDKVKVTIMFRGREVSHAASGKVICDKLAEQLREIAVVEKKPDVEGRNMIMVLAPKQK